MSDLAFEPRNDIERLLADMLAGAVEPEDFAHRLMDMQVFMPIKDEKHQIAGFQRSTQAEPLVLDDEDDLPLGRLTFTHCLDMATRYPLGYYMGFEPPGVLAVMECLYHAILPKEGTRERYGTEHEWLGHGVPAVLVVDNGSAPPSCGRGPGPGPWPNAMARGIGCTAGWRPRSSAKSPGAATTTR